MPRPKEVKEQVVYPASKRKAPAFKPQRPSKLPRTSTTDSERSSAAPATGARDTTAEQMMPRLPSLSARLPSAAPSRRPSETVDLSSDEKDSIGDSSDDLPDDPLATIIKKPISKAPARKTSTRGQQNHADPSALEDALAPDIDQDANIPQALLLRLMHEHFEDKSTKIDKTAIGAVQRYVDLFVRETMARAALMKKEEVDLGKASQSDANWLDKGDLEKVAGGMLLDF